MMYLIDWGVIFRPWTMGYIYNPWYLAEIGKFCDL